MKELKRILPYARPYRWTAFLLLITVILPVAMELVVPRALRTVIDVGIEAGNLQAIVSGSGLMLAAALIGALATLGQGVCRAQLSQGLAYDLREALFGHIQQLSFANLDKMQTGQLMTRLSSDVDIVRMFTTNGLALLLRALLMILGSIILMFLLDWQLALVMLVLIFLAGILIRTVMRLAQPLFAKVQEWLSALNTTVQENLAGARVVKAFVREAHEIGRFEVQNTGYRDQTTKVGRLMAMALPALTLITNLGIVAVIWMGGLSVENGRLSVGEVVAFSNYLMIGMAPLMLLGNILTMFSRAATSAERIWEILDTTPTIREAPSLTVPPSPIAGRVTFSGVYFSYDGQVGDSRKDGQNGREQERRDVLQDVTFTVEPGQHVALLGATGSGKSSLVNLIPRFYDPNAGAVSVDGFDVREWSLEVLRSSIGMVMQQPILFSGTIRENIAYGRPDATQEEIEAAARAAQAHDFIIALADGYESEVEERGANLSGGQKQRIAIARALLVRPSILILDDSTSAVDMETEALIQDALEELMHGRTTLTIAQRVGSVIGADQILVLEHGRITSRGTHTQLLQTSSVYQEIFQSQLGQNGLEQGPSRRHDRQEK